MPYGKLVRRCSSVNPRLHMKDAVSNLVVLYINIFTHNI